MPLTPNSIMNTPKVIPLEVMIWLLACLFLFSCSTTGPVDAFYSASATIKVPMDRPYGQARRLALQSAEIDARHSLLKQLLELDIDGNGRIKQHATADPFVRAMVMDLIRNGRISSRGINDNGQASVTVELNRETIDQFLADLTTH
jgi:hypothetical protein